MPPFYENPAAMQHLPEKNTVRPDLAGLTVGDDAGTGWRGPSLSCGVKASRMNAR